MGGSYKYSALNAGTIIILSEADYGIARRGTRPTAIVSSPSNSTGHGASEAWYDTGTEHMPYMITYRKYIL